MKKRAGRSSRRRNGRYSLTRISSAGTSNQMERSIRELTTDALSTAEHGLPGSLTTDLGNGLHGSGNEESVMSDQGTLAAPGEVETQHATSLPTLGVCVSEVIKVEDQVGETQHAESVRG